MTSSPSIWTRYFPLLWGHILHHHMRRQVLVRWTQYLFSLFQSCGCKCYLFSYSLRNCGMNELQKNQMMLELLTQWALPDMVSDWWVKMRTKAEVDSHAHDLALLTLAAKNSAGGKRNGKDSLTCSNSLLFLPLSSISWFGTNRDKCVRVKEKRKYLIGSNESYLLFHFLSLLWRPPFSHRSFNFVMFDSHPPLHHPRMISSFSSLFPLSTCYRPSHWLLTWWEESESKILSVKRTWVKRK